MNNAISVAIACFFMYLTFSGLMEMENRRQERIVQIIYRVTDLVEKGHLKQSDLEKIKENLK